jgi:uncharacterized Ntn-hydrolase superfamily protein
MTYSVIARCPRTHQIGLGVATYSLACGSFTQGAQSPYGISMSQANVRKGNSPLANSLLAQGHSSKSVLASLVSDDEHEAFRQLAVMTRDGKAAVHTGSKVAGWCGQISEQDYAIFGNVLEGPHVLSGMRDGLLSNLTLPLQERLIQSLEGGRDAGGQGSGGAKMAERSACVVLFDRRSCAEWDLRVDFHDHAVEELRRIYTAFKPYQPYYNERDADPSRTLSQLAWERQNLPEGT